MRATHVGADCETSGLFDFSKPADAAGQPRLAALALIYLDAALEPLEEYHTLIRPDGWEMSPEVTAINGLTTERLRTEGVPVAEALKRYTDAVDFGAIVVAFNAQFDTKVLRGELRRLGLNDRFESTPNICTMRPMVGVCRLPKARGGGFKFPKLIEAYRHFFKSDFEGVHTALGDCRANVRLFRKLVELDLAPEPAVHYAKEKPAESAAPKPKRNDVAHPDFAAGATMPPEVAPPPPLDGPIQTDMPSIF